MSILHRLLPEDGVPSMDDLPVSRIEGRSPSSWQMPVGSAARVSMSTPEPSIRLEVLIVRRASPVVVVSSVIHRR